MEWLNDLLNNTSIEVEKELRKYCEINKISKGEFRQNAKRVKYANHPLEEYYFYKDDLICKTRIRIIE